MATSATALISAFVLGLGAKARSAAKPIKRLRRRLEQPDRSLGRVRNRVVPFRSMLRRLRLRNIRYVGVTGSCGKTTTTKLIGAVLSTGGPCHVGAGYEGVGTTTPDLTGLSVDSKFCVHKLYGTRPGRLKPALRTCGLRSAWSPRSAMTTTRIFAASKPPPWKRAGSSNF